MNVYYEEDPSYVLTTKDKNDIISSYANIYCDIYIEEAILEDVYATNGFKQDYPTWSNMKVWENRKNEVIAEIKTSKKPLEMRKLYIDFCNEMKSQYNLVKPASQLDIDARMFLEGFDDIVLQKLNHLVELE